jgi:hypothetical protein
MGILPRHYHSVVSEAKRAFSNTETHIQIKTGHSVRSFIFALADAEDVKDGP